MSDLPYEIWQHISSFLSVEEAWVLHGLNHILRDIALDTRYRCVKANFSPHHYASYASRFRHLGDDLISGRVREVHLLPYVPFDPFDFPGDQTRRNSLSLYLKGQLDEMLKPDQDSMMNTIARLTNVSRLRIESTHDNCRQTLRRGLPLIQGALRTFSSNLRSLVLSFPLEIMSSIIFPDVVFSRLESLEIDFSNMGPSTLPDGVNMKFAEDAKEAILPFVDRHRQSLRSFSFGLPQYQQAFTPFIPPPNPLVANFIIDHIFEGINYIPHLESASFSTPTALPRGHPIFHFFEKHSKSLRCLNIYMENMAILNLHDFMERVETPMPHLKVLTLDFGFRSRSLMIDPSPAKFLRQYSPSLETLKMSKKQHGKGEVFSIFELTPGSSIFYSKLRYLEIWVYCLTPEMLDLFSSSLPNLEDLDLALRIFKGGDASIRNERSQFCIEMRCRQYVSWNLKRLTLGNLDSQRKIVSNVNCISAVVEALPSLLTINEVPRTDYLSGF